MKKKVIKPFSLDEYQNNNCKAETRCGYHVNFLKPDAICIWEADDHESESDYPMMAELDTPMGHRLAFYTTEGKFYAGDVETDMDLVLVEEQEIPSVTKEEFESYIDWFIHHEHDVIEELDKTVAEYIEEKLLVMSPPQKDAQDAKREDVNYCALKLEGVEEIPNEEFAKSYVKFAVSCVNDALGYSAKKRNAFGWKKVWDNQGYFGVIETEKAKMIIEKYPEFPFKICTTKVRQHHGEAEPEVHMD